MHILLVIIGLMAVCRGSSAESSDRAFECFVCNKDPHEDDSEPCIKRIEACEPNVTSCSSVAFRTGDGKLRIRKFCTSPGIPIYQYLMIFPGSSLCQNIETASIPDPPPEPITVPGPDGKPTIALPPAPPSRDTSTMLCVCTKPKCNGGTYREVMERNMLKNLEPPETGKGDGRLKKLDLFFDKSVNPPPIQFL